ncbi:MAG TPA: hydrogenase maturation protease [archaeon]|nr:hydrogenase maturation protease [archaeon]
MKTLIIGIGNPGRTDDGLGPALAEKVESWDNPGIRVSIDYQLNIEYALEVSEADVVLFIDASLEAPPPFSFYRIYPVGKIACTTHAMEPETVLATCQEVFGKLPPAFVLGLRGENFDLGEELSPSAKLHLKDAERFLADLLKPGDVLDRCLAAAASGG